MYSESNQVQVRCIGCQTLLNVPSELLGKSFSCSQCGKIMTLALPRTSSGAANTPPVQAPSSANDLFGFPPAGFDTPYSSYTSPPSQSFGNYDTNRKVVKKGPPVWLFSMIGIGSALGLIFLGIIASLVIGSSNRSTFSLKTADSMANSSSFGNAEAANPMAVAPTTSVDFPNLGAPQAFGNSGIVWYRVLIDRPSGIPLKLNIFIPGGNHADKSLPVVFEAPAGTPLIHGASIEIPSPDTELLPFTEAGMITISYDIDGAMEGNASPDDGMAYMTALRSAYSRFVASDAGVSDGKLAIDFALARLPMADPSQLITWGHSSAATLSLLLASKDSRITKCIAMAPITDLRPRLGEILVQEPAMAKFLPNFDTYLVSGSPKTHIATLRCDVFIAHAKNDDNAPFSETKTYVDALRRNGGKITFLELEREGHYAPLLEAAIPKALQWLR